VAELAYAADLKSADLTVLRVRVPSSVLIINSSGDTNMDTRKENEERKTKKEATHYWPTRLRVDGQTVWILLTDAEVGRAVRRAENNPEDVPGLWERIRLVFGL
jgi:hypothetical protein